MKNRYETECGINRLASTRFIDYIHCCVCVCGWKELVMLAIAESEHAYHAMHHTLYPVHSRFWYVQWTLCISALEVAHRLRRKNGVIQYIGLLFTDTISYTLNIFYAKRKHFGNRFSKMKCYGMQLSVAWTWEAKDLPAEFTFSHSVIRSNIRPVEAFVCIFWV